MNKKNNVVLIMIVMLVMIACAGSASIAHTPAAVIPDGDYPVENVVWSNPASALIVVNEQRVWVSADYYVTAAAGICFVRVVEGTIYLHGCTNGD